MEHNGKSIFKDLTIRPTPLTDGIIERILPEKCRSGDKTLTVGLSGGRKYYIHSKYDPAAEAENFALSLNLKEKNLIVLGCGLFHHVAKILEKKHFNKVICLEFSSKIFQAALENAELARLPRGLISMGVMEDRDDISAYLSLALTQGDRNSIDIVLFNPVLNYLKEAGTGLYDDLKNIFVLRNSWAKFGRRIKKNILNNIDNLAGSYPAGGLKGAFARRPCIIAAAGASLDDALPQIKKLQDGAYIIAVGRTLRLLQEAGIRPDFTAVTDPQRKLKYQFSGAGEMGGNHLVYIPTAYPGAAALCPDRFVSLVEGDDIGPSFDKLGDWAGRLETGGSVSTLALSFAVSCGFDPVILAGQDLCVRDGMKHSMRLFALEESANSSRFQTVLNLKKASSDLSGEIVKLPYQGCYTLRPLMIYKNWIEGFIEKHPDTVFCNISSGGLPIKGAPAVNPAKLDSMKNFIRGKESVAAAVARLGLKKLGGENLGIIKKELQGLYGTL